LPPRSANRSRRNNRRRDSRVPPPTPAGCHVNLMPENKTNSWPPSVAAVVVFQWAERLASAAERSRMKPNAPDSVLSEHVDLKEY